MHLRHRRRRAVYFDPNQVRRDIVEDRAGAPFRIAIKVMGVGEGCEPLEGAIVDLWHADAGGVYSGFTGQLGGLDTTDRNFPARDSVDRCRRGGPVRHRLSGLVPRTHGACPFQDSLRRGYVPDFAVLFPRRIHRSGFRAVALQRSAKSNYSQFERFGTQDGSSREQSARDRGRPWRGLFRRDHGRNSAIEARIRSFQALTVRWSHHGETRAIRAASQSRGQCNHCSNICHSRSSHPERAVGGTAERSPTREP